MLGDKRTRRQHGADFRIQPGGSAVPCQALRARLATSTPCRQELAGRWIVRGRERDLKTSVNKLRFAGCQPRFRFFVRGCPCLNAGVDPQDRPHGPIGSSPAVVRPALLHDACHMEPLAGERRISSGPLAFLGRVADARGRGVAAAPLNRSGNSHHRHCSSNPSPFFLAHRDAGDGGRPLHQKRTLGLNGRSGHGPTPLDFGGPSIP